MKRNLLSFLSIFALYGLFAFNSYGQGTNEVITCSEFHITKPIRDIPYVEKNYGNIESEDRENRPSQTFVFSAADGSIYGNDSSILQTEMGPTKINGKATLQNWAGQTATGFRPFDPSGAVGPNHYVQMINSTTFRVFNKTGTVLLTQTLGNLWAPTTGNAGDPIVLYDKYADRWFLAQFGTNANKRIYIAISTSGDPTGTYYTYTFTSANFPDYLKFSIWENGYYMTSNQGGIMWCFERSQMLLGNAGSRGISATFTTGNTGGFFCPLPADAEGGLPPAGTPLPFAWYTDNAWGGGAIDGVKIWNMTVNWAATPTASCTLAATIATSIFDASYDASWNDISQPGTGTKLDGIGGVPTYRAQWRKWAGYNTLVMNWGVKISATQRSIMWVELRQDQTTGVWSLYQQGTYTPDAHSRWMGSIAMDNNGSIALCYAKSSTTVYPSLGYTGRLACDPLGTMTFAEVIAIAGDKVQTSTNRFGDYAQTSLDPDGLTFWHTGEYIADPTSNNLVKTRIYSFQLPVVVTPPTVSIALTSGTNPTCSGSSVTFLATPTNGGATPVYQWKVNGTNVGTNSPTYTTTTLTNGQVVTCLLTSNICANLQYALSNAITMTVNSSVTPSVSISITTGSNPSCSGSSVTFTAAPTNGGTTPTYQWKVDGTNVATGLTFTTTTLTTGQVVSCVMTSNASCANPLTANSNAITMTINTAVTPAVSIAITTGANPTCAGTSVTFTASPTNGGTMPTYQWKVNGTNVATGVSYTTTTLTNGQIVTCVMTSNASCASPLTAASNAITMTVNAIVIPSVSISLTSGTNPMCAGSSATFTAAPTNGGTIPTYQWKVDGTNVGTGSTYTTTGLTNGQIVTCVMTSNAACASPLTANSNAIAMTVNAAVIPSVSIALTTGTNPSCAGSSVTFTATPTNGGTTPAYQWKVDGTNVGTGLTYTSTTLTNGQVVTCVMTSNASCASPLTANSNAITMTINTAVTPAVSIAITTGANPTCAGTSVTFTATPTNGGTTPSYQWKVNGTNVATGVTYTTTTLTNGQIVTCVMTSNASCASPLTASSNAITMTVNAAVTPSVSISLTSGTNPMCAGYSATFTAAPTNGGTTPTYQWKVNGTNVATGVSYTTTTLTNGQIVTCVMTSNAACASPLTANSNAITMTVNAAVIPSVSIALTTGTNPSCGGSSVTFTATPTNGGTTPTYQWKVDGANVATGLTYTTTTLTNGQVVTCVMTSNASCASPLTANSNAITMTINTAVTPAVSIAITTGTNPTCAGTSVTFTASPTNGGTTPTYQWKVNGTNVATGVTYTTTTLTNGQIVTCVMTSNASCASPLTANSNAITMTVNAAVTPSVSISLTSGTNPMCSGSSATFTATPTNGGTTPTYQWKVNGTNVATGVSYTTATLTNGQIVTCVMTSNAACASPLTANSNAITMTVNAAVIPSVSIALTTGTNPSCAGSSVTFTATPTNGGTTPTYQWKVDGTNVATGLTYTTTTLTNGQVVTCVMTSNATCASPLTATSNAINMTVNSTLVPAVSIALTAGTNPTCSGSSVTFTATPTNGGTTPTYQWKVNGTNVATGLTYTTTTLTNGQVVTCVMTSNASCASPLTANSNAITMTVNAAVTPSVSISLTSGTNPMCAGSSATFTAAPTNGGTTPTYQWKVDGINVGTGSTYTTTALTNGQVVTCVMTSNATCASPLTANSNAITMTVNAVVIPSVSILLTAGTNPSCVGSSVTFTATPTNGGTTPAYQWKVDGTNVGTGLTYTTTTLTNGQVVTCVMTSNATCASPLTASSNAITMTVNSILTPGVSIGITSGSNPSCVGASVTFTATPSNGGTSPTYQWKVDGTNVGTGSTYTTTALTNGQVVTCVMTSNASCASPLTATSNAVTMVVNSTVTPSVLIAITSGSNPMCAGASVTFTATPTNGGTAPVYQWKVDGSNAGTGATFTTTTLTNGQVVSCEMTSNMACANPAVVNSNTLTMTVYAIPPTPTITQNGLDLTSSSASGNQWYLDGTIIPGATTQTYTCLVNGSYTVVVTIDGCSSNTSLPVEIINVGTEEVNNIYKLNIFPNPNEGKFTISFYSSSKSNYKIEIVDAIGQQLYKENIVEFKGTYSKKINLTEFGYGVYTIILTNAKNETIKKIIVF